MRMLILRAVLTLELIAADICGQLHIIVGAPGQEFPMTLMQVEPDGSVKAATTLVPEYWLPGVTRWPAPAVDWFAISYEERKALIIPVNPASPVLVLDLDKAAIVKRCHLPSLKDMGRITQWLADVPGKGLTFEWFEVSNDVTRKVTRSMTMDPSSPCEYSFAQVDPSEIRYFVAHGNAGVADMETSEQFHTWMDKDGNLESGWLGPAGVSLGYRVPAELRQGLDRPQTGVVVNNSRVLVLSIGPQGMATPAFLAFRKRDKTWRRIPVQSDYYSRLRGFEGFVAVVEERLKKTIAAQRRRNGIYMGRVDEPGDESAGRREWRRKRSATGPDQEEGFRNAATVYPGRLHLYDVDTERLFTIRTDQADSEILLVENNTIYYRISDRLYSAPITDQKIGSPRLLAAAEEIRNAHWAFIKH